jgi:hypothetical protein
MENINTSTPSTIEALESKHVDLVNSLISLSSEQDSVWEYHPKNPNHTNPEEYYKILEDKMKVIENQIELCWSKINQLKNQ